ncbi:MAG: ABC transporter permease [Cyclobacteriaceae bacterium]|nr:ABC transporter permease [Cyclobacteriaceae bacterium]
MLLNYLKLSLRLLARNPFFTGINILGLSVGFASFFILWQYSSSELKADQHHQDFEQIGRLGAYWRFPQEGNWGLLTFGGIRLHQAPTIAEDFPQVEQYVRVLMQPEFDPDLVGHDSRIVVSLSREDGGRELFEETRMVYTDSNFFSFFTIPLLKGEKTTVLKNARTVVLAEQTARKYFGSSDPVGQFILVNNSVSLLVTGVFQDLPHNTHLAIDLVASMTALPVNESYSLANTYIKVGPHAVLEDLVSEINKNSAKYWAAELRTFPEGKADIFFQPLTDIAFSAHFERDYLTHKSKPTLRVMQFASCLILLMAWINYNNLTASRMMKRMKEIATRKMSGALSADFARQFFVESCLVNLLAAALAFTVMQLVRVPARELFNIHIAEFHATNYKTWLIFGVAILSGILVSGLYPTMMSASYNPRSLFFMAKKSRSTRWIQSLLTTSQYVMALVLILWAFIIYLQLDFILGKDLGIEREQVVIIDAPVIKSETYTTEFESFLQELRSLNGIVEATYSSTVIGDADRFFVFMKGPAQGNSTSIDSNGGVDESYIPFYGIQLIAGRNFVANDKSDVVILSRQATKRLGFSEPGDAVGQNILVDMSDTVHVVGVINDYRVKPLLNLSSTMTENAEGWGIGLLYKNGIHEWRVPERISVRIEMDKLGATLEKARALFARTFSGNVFHWYFLNDHITKVYSNDKIARNQIALFTSIAIGLSCLGLLGMMTTIAEEKVKEIGIRKVLGAGVKQIGQGLLRNVFTPVIPAIAIAIPIAYYLSGQYLDRYLEKIELQWWHFALPALILISLLFGTIASMLIKAAKGNPVEALKHE